MSSTLNGLRSGDMLDKVKHTVAEVGNASSLVVEANPYRRHLLIINDSDETIYITHLVPAQIHFGMRVERNGGRMEFSQDKNNVCAHAIYAIQAKPQSKRLLITEGS